MRVFTHPAGIKQHTYWIASIPTARGIHLAQEKKISPVLLRPKVMDLADSSSKRYHGADVPSQSQC
jgi:hypothetical protein